MIVATAMSHPNSVLLTEDIGDMRALSEQRPDLTVAVRGISTSPDSEKRQGR
jgi:hypothetical protein